MPVTYRVDLECDVILATAAGTVTLEDLQAYISSVLGDPDVRPGFNELLDLREVTEVAIPPLDPGPVVDSVRDVDQGLKQRKSAAVASTDNEAAITPLYRLLRDVLPNEFRLFVDWHAALDWLGIAADTPEQRRALRKPVSLTVLCRTGLEEASGRLRNISLSGAFIESKSLRPGRGRFVNVRLHAPKIDEEIELTGTVVRQTNAGFAIQFVKATEQLQRMLDA